VSHPLSGIFAGVMAAAIAASGGGGPAPSAPTLVYLGSAELTSSTTTQTFASFPFGTAAADREIIVFLGHNASTGSARGHVTGVTIGGITATKDEGTSASGAVHGSIWRAAVPTGTSGSVVVTIDGSSGSANRWSCHGYGITNRLTTGAAPYDTAIQAAAYSNSPTPTVSIDHTANGQVVAGLRHLSATATTWTGATEDYDGNASGAPKGSVAQYTNASAGVAHAIGWSGGGSGTGQVTCAASYN
jgi:hypothetical protein